MGVDKMELFITVYFWFSLVVLLLNIFSLAFKEDQIGRTRVIALLIHLFFTLWAATLLW
jgi:hypothetical protein